MGLYVSEVSVSSSVVLARSSGSFCKQRCKKLRISCDHLSACWSCGGSREGICRKATMGCSSLRGTQLSAISSKVTPRDHTSHLGPYGDGSVRLSITSGAIQYGEPMNV